MVIARASAAGYLLQNRQDRERLDEYRRNGGYTPLHRSADELLEEVERAGLRGRGGAGFPTAVKWQSVRSGARARHVVVNAEEGEPASHKDRWLLVHRPHLVLEGALVAAAAVGADHVWVYVSDAAAADGVAAAIEELMTGTLPFGQHRLPKITLSRVGRTYVAGEETAVVRALSGGPALPSVKPPRPGEAGVEGRPTLVQNAETLAHAALIVRHGAAWFRGAGTATSPGTFLLSLGGDCPAPGLYETALGATLRELVAPEAGVAAGAGPVGFIFGGYFGGLVGPRAVDLPLEYDSLRAAGVGLGCGAITVIGAGRCPVAVAAALLEFFAAESAKQCGVCVRGTEALRDTALRLRYGPVRGDEAALLARYATAIRGRGACGLPDGASNVVTSLEREFPDAVSAHLAHGCARCPDDLSGLVPALCRDHCQTGGTKK